MWKKLGKYNIKEQAEVMDSLPNTSGVADRLAKIFKGDKVIWLVFVILCARW